MENKVNLTMERMEKSERRRHYGMSLKPQLGDLPSQSTKSYAISHGLLSFSKCQRVQHTFCALITHVFHFSISQHCAHACAKRSSWSK